ncbi:hypothetical protein MMC09_002978 [Bachmanniomyces sp. S44760]|nr:hypothetical protein [Bachmanniomyces sp. S44760]
MNRENYKIPDKPFPLLDFTTPETIPDFKTMSDADIGGFSKVNLDHVPATPSEPAHARFYGNISMELPPDRPQIYRSGFAAFRNWDRKPTIFGKSLWDMSLYKYLALRIKSDGRKYFVNIQSETIVFTDIHQHRLYARHPGEWETVLLQWNEFVRTNHGVVVEPQSDIDTSTVRTIGIGLIDRVAGPYDLAVSSIWATNDHSEGRSKEHQNMGKVKESMGVGHLVVKKKQDQSIK